MVDFTRPTKPNTRIPPILARRYQNQQPSISTPSQPEEATHIINLSQRKLSAESNNADPSLRRCLAHHRLLTKSIFEAKSDMRVYLDEVEYESDSEDEEDEDAVFDEHVEVVETFHKDNDNVRVVDGDDEVENMLFHEEPTVHQEEIILSHPNPLPGLPVPSNMAVTMPMSMSMPVSAYTPTSTASTLTHQPRSKTSRPSFSSKIDCQSTSSIASREEKASMGLAASVEPSAGGVSSDATLCPSSTSQSTSTSTPNTKALDSSKDEEDHTDTPPPRPPLSTLPSLMPINRTSSAPNVKTATTSPTPQKAVRPIKDKIVSTVKGLVKRRNSSHSCLPSSSVEDTPSQPTKPVLSKDQHDKIAESTEPNKPAMTETEQTKSKAEEEEKGNRPALQHLSTKNASCSSIPVRIKIHEDIARNPGTGAAMKMSSSPASQNTQMLSHAQMQSKSVAKRGRQYAQRLGERVGVAVPVTT